MLAARAAASAQATQVAQATMPAPESAPAPPRGRPVKEPPSVLAQALNSSMARTVAGVITRGIMGALLGTPRRRRR
jgi:hypothetical protein